MVGENARSIAMRDICRRIPCTTVDHNSNLKFPADVCLSFVDDVCNKQSCDFVKLTDMSDISDCSDKDSVDEVDDKDEDFNVEEVRDEIDSDESLDDLLENSTANTNDKEPQNASEKLCGSVLPGGHRFDKSFTCIRYPGNVVNSEKAIETLGGVTNISTAVDVRNRRLELRFRPNDGYCKPACGDRHTVSAFLLRIRVKKSRVQKSESQRTNDNCTDKNKTGSTETKTNSTTEKLENESRDCNNESQNINNSVDNDITELKNIRPTFERGNCEDLSADTEYTLPKLKVLGRVETEFRFTNLCDFQYLPITANLEEPTKNECIYDKLYPVDIPPFKWLKNEVPFFLPPAAFSRMDNVQQYVPKTEMATSSHPENIIAKTRKRRAGFSNFINFSTPDIPIGPPKGIETAMKVKFLQNFHLERIRKFFEARPIWSKTALIYESGFTGEQLKILLPSVAYYFMTGPWRIMWVKLGYDPRLDPHSSIYQTLDYRLKAMHGLEGNVTCKRNYSEYTLPYKSTPISRPKTMVLMSNINQNMNQKKKESMNENVYIYREGMIPSSRQMFYQYCDIHVDEIQKMLSNLPDPAPGTKCHEKLGWLPVGFDAYCREVLNKQIRAELRKRMNVPENYPAKPPTRRRNMGFPTGKKKQIPKKKKRPPPPAYKNCPSEEEWEDEAAAMGNSGPESADDETKKVKA